MSTAPPPRAAIWTALIVFHGNRFHRSVGNLWKCRSPNVTGSGRLMKETLACGMRGRRVNAVIDSAQTGAAVFFGL